MLKTKKIERKDAAAVLLKVVTNEHFRRAQATMTQSTHHSDKDEQFNLKEKADEQIIVARATAWSLTKHGERKELEAIRN